MKYYLYRHIRLDKNEPFYIGIGTVNTIDENSLCYSEYWRRAFAKTSRNPYWRNIVAKTKYEIEILYESYDLNHIKEKETEFIILHGRKDLGTGMLCNMTDGGDGINGYKHSEECKKRMGDKKRGTKLKNVRKGHKFSKEHGENVSKALKGKYTGERHWHTGKKLTEYHRSRIIQANTGRKHTEEAKLKMRVPKNYIRTLEHRRKLSEAQINKSKNIKVIRIEKGKEQVFDSVRKASIETGTPTDTIYGYLSNRRIKPRNNIVWKKAILQ